MDYALLAQDRNFHEWGKLEPLHTDYVKYGETNPAIIAALQLHIKPLMIRLQILGIE